MTGNVYSTYDLAKSKAYEKRDELECDIFICKSRYSSGEEFTLKTKDDLTCNTHLYMLPISFRHRFKSRANAEREADIFADKKVRAVYVKKKIEKRNGYDVIKYFYLTYTECLTSAQ